MSKETRNVRTPCLLGDKCKPKYLMNVTTVAHRSPSTVTRRVFIACWIQSKSSFQEMCLCSRGLSAGSEVVFLMLLHGPNVDEQALVMKFGALLWR